MLTQAQLKEYLNYDPETGNFTWVSSTPKSRRAVVGSAAGSFDGQYQQIRLLGKKYRAHVLAWLYMTGVFSSADIDHINRNKLDNSWRNLREVSRSQNNLNRSGIRGVLRSKSGRWSARLKHKGKQLYLGTFDTKEQAYAAYQEKINALYPGFISSSTSQ